MSAYIVISLVIMILACILLMKSMDRYTTHLRKIVLIVVMTSLAVLGRIVFGFLPWVQPMMAVIILTGVYFGKESGFWAGTLTIFISNFSFGQGPWTPVQMLALGLLGLVAGALGEYLRSHKIALVLFGAACGVIYSLLMDVWTVVWSFGGFSISWYFAAIIAAIPYTVAYAVSTAVLLALLQKPLGCKLERMVVKYGV